MTNKIKVIFGSLAVLAILSVLSWVDYFNKGMAANFNLANIASKFTFGTETDADKDGLSNIEESYWNTDFQNPDTDGDGFKDGEEVASGHDPNKAGPDDSLKDINLTEKLAELTASGLYEGSLKLDSDNFEQSLADIADYADDNAGFALNRNVSPEILTTIDSNNNSQDKYLSETYEIIKLFLTSYGKEIQGLQKNLDLIGGYGFGHKDVQEYFSNQEKLFKEIFNKATEISVPKNWAQNHLTLLGEIKIVVESNRAIVLGKNDPIKAAMAFSELFGIIDKIPNWSNVFIDKNRDEKINNMLIESLSK